METNTHAKITVFALVLSVVALLISTISLSKAGSAVLDDEEFMSKVEEGIEAYIDKQQAAQAGPSEPIDVSIDDDAIKGDKDAPVTIVEFSDFECPFCGRFSRDTLPQIMAEYVDTGKARFIYRDFPLSFHRNAKAAAVAAECAHEAGGDEAYFAYNDKLYENQTMFSVENFKAWAVELGLNASQFNECLDSEKYGEEVDKDFADGQSYGVTGTPAFFINGRKVSGAQPFSVFQTIIDEELAK